MREVAVVIPNYNGMKYLKECLSSLEGQNCEIILVDNGSMDGSVDFVKKHFPLVNVICLNKNYGFSRAVNEGIKAAESKYVILLNNDTRAAENFVSNLVGAMKRNKKIFSCQAKMLQMDHPDRIDDAGDYYNAMGWAIARGKNRADRGYDRPVRIFSSCAGAAIYRKEVFGKIGYFDEKHFAYLEDVDIGYRANICGYENWLEPSAVVYHKGSGSSGSRYNAFKVRHASRNNLYLIYKNMSLWQIWINLPLLLLGVLVKAAFFLAKGLGPYYFAGLWQGILLARSGEKFPLLAENFDNCCRIQLSLWKNLTFLLKKN